MERVRKSRLCQTELGFMPKWRGSADAFVRCGTALHLHNRVALNKADILLLLSRWHGRKCSLFEVHEALTSATGTPSGGRQCSTIMPFSGTSAPWGSCSKFFLRSARENKQPVLQNSYNTKKAPPSTPRPEKQFVLSVRMCHIWTGTWWWGSNAFYETTPLACRGITSSPDNKINLGWEWPQAAYRRSGQLPCGSWRSPGGSRRRTGTSNPPGHESPPPAGGRRWSSPHGSSALQTRWLIA